MQVKKFEAPTIQEALETIKRELGPEAIILQTKKNARGFGLLSRASVEITAAVSERSLQKKKFAEDRLPQTNREAIVKMPAEKQAEVYDKMMEKHIEKVANTTRDRVDLGGRIKAAAPGSTERKPITATRYIDIEPPQTPMRGALP
jgi:flagellar biosynthesis protein FlhF